MSLLRIVALLLTAAAPLSCARGEPPGAEREAPPALPPARAGVAASASVSARAPAAPSASVAAVAAADAGGVDADSIDWKNKLKPELSTPGLEQHGRVLLDAIAKDDPELAKDFFFPRAPFTPLKDVANPDRYWVQLYATYKRDIHEMHRKRRDWTGATFESLRLGSPPTWVKPGDEYNKIGYYRTFNAKLRYTIGERKGVIDVHTIISWQGDWYVTHLGAIKH